MKLIFAAIVALAPGGVAAGTIGEQDQMVINRVNATDFEVIEGINYGAAEFWCGAATFVQRRSGLPGQTLIFVKRPEGPALTAPGRDGVVFTTSAAGLPDAAQSLTLTVDAPGTSLLSQKAYRYCRDAFTRSTK